MLTLTNLVTRVANRLNKNANDSIVATRIKNHINDTCLEKWNSYAWSFRYRDYPLVLSPVVTTGTVTATNGSQTVTASGTPFSTTTHVGAWIQFTEDSTQAVYRVQAVASTSSLTIEPAYQGTTGSGKSYRLCVTDYLLPSEVLDTASLSVSYNGRPLSMSHQLTTNEYLAPVLTSGTPTSVTVFNRRITSSSYSTGTVSGTINTSTLTGVGTAWLTNVMPGDEITISGDTNIYKVYAVNSDTSLTLYNLLVSAASGAAYSTSRQFGKVLRITPCSDTSYVCYVKGLRAYTPLLNNSDVNELLYRYPHAVVEGAVWREAGSSPDPREDGLYMRSEKLWMDAMSEDEQLFPMRNNQPIWDSRQQGR